MSSTSIRLSRNISAQDVEGWTEPLEEPMRFVVFKSCAFEPEAEGLALSYLARAVEVGASISLHCEFELPTTSMEFYSTLLSSIFGYTLIRSCQAAFFLGSEADEKAALRSFSGRTYDDNLGVVGLGNEVRLISFDPKRPIPKALLSSTEALDRQGLPLPSAFHQDILKILGGMGLQEIASPTTLPVLISFIHELFINTCQHGLPQSEKIGSISTRGIGLSKIAYSIPQLHTRQISVHLREFLERIAEMQKKQSNLLVVCISVMDMGVGIQHTLPPLKDVEETASERLLRAFKLGESRKSNATTESGAGLHRVVEVAHRLGARLQVSSAGIRLVKDFSFGEDKLPSMAGAIETTLPEHFCNGTSVEIFIPRLVTNIDQQELNV